MQKSNTVLGNGGGFFTKISFELHNINGETKRINNIIAKIDTGATLSLINIRSVGY